MDGDTSLALARAGDPEAFARLAAPHEQRVWGLCWQMMGNTEDAQDAMQEAMLRAWRALPGYRGDAAFGTWLYRIATTCCLDALRRRRARPAESLEERREAGFDPPDAGDTPEERLLRRERHAELRAALDSLPEERRAPLILCAVEGLTCEEAAQALRLPVGTVKSRVSRARAELKKHLQYGNSSVADASKKDERGRAT